MNFLTLFFEFFKTGLFAVGGGMATLPFLYDMAGRHPEWFTAAEVADMLAVSESTPGPIGVNMATFAGYKMGGIGGALVATLGLITPSVIVILLVALFLKSFRNSPVVESVFYGLRPASSAMIAAAGLTVVGTTLVHPEVSGWGFFDWKAILLAAVLLVLTRWVKPTKKLHPILFILASAVAGVVFSF